MVITFFEWSRNIISKEEKPLLALGVALNTNAVFLWFELINLFIRSDRPLTKIWIYKRESIWTLKVVNVHPFGRIIPTIVELTSKGYVLYQIFDILHKTQTNIMSCHQRGNILYDVKKSIKLLGSTENGMKLF